MSDKLSAVRTWLRNGGATVKLGRPTFFSPEEEDIIATYMVSWTKGGDLLKFHLSAVLLRQCITDVGRVEEAERTFGEGGVPGRTFFHHFLGWVRADRRQTRHVGRLHRRSTAGRRQG